MNHINYKRGIKKAFVLAALFVVAPLPLSIEDATPVLASAMNQLNGKIHDTTKQLEKKQAKATSLKSQVAILNSRMFQLQTAIWKTQAELRQTNSQIHSLNEKIRQNEVNLQAQKRILNEYLKTLYEEDNISTVEIIASSGNFSDFVDRSEYLQVMQLKIKEVVDKIKAIQGELGKSKLALTEKKNELNKTRKKQSLQQRALDSQRIYRNRLLRIAETQARSYENKLNNLYAQKAAMSAAYGEGFVGGSSSYPYGNHPAGNMIDTPDPWGYLIGECTSYVAWKRASLGRPVARAMGNAGAWAGSSNSSTPSPGAVAIFPYVGYYGHVAFVEAVYGNGSILISEYNWTPYSYSSRVINPYNYGIVYIR